MTDIIAEVEKKNKTYHAAGVSLEAVASAEKELGLDFSPEYKEYLGKYGVLSFAAHEFMGLGVDGYLNVVTATKKERDLNADFPKDCILLENIGIEGILIIQDKDGNVYSYVNGNKKKIASSFAEYIKSLL